MTICSVLSKKPEDFNDSQTDSLLLGLPEEILIKISLWVTTGPRGMRDIHQWGQVCFLTHTLFHSENIQQIIQKDAVLELFWTEYRLIADLLKRSTNLAKASEVEDR